MKRLLVLLFGVLAFQGSVWADMCSFDYIKMHSKGGITGYGDAAQVISPKQSDVFVKGSSFSLRWDDPARILGDVVEVNLFRIEKFVRFATPTRPTATLYAVSNTGNTLIPYRHLKHANIVAGDEYYLEITPAYEDEPERQRGHSDGIYMRSDCFTFKERVKRTLDCQGKTMLKDCVDAHQQTIDQLTSVLYNLRNRMESVRELVDGGNNRCNENEGKPFVFAGINNTLMCPACWKRGIKMDTTNPWVVGKGDHPDYPQDANCLRKCAMNETCWKKSHVQNYGEPIYGDTLTCLWSEDALTDSRSVLLLPNSNRPESEQEKLMKERMEVAFCAG